MRPSHDVSAGQIRDQVRFRQAALADVPVLRALIETSVRALSRDDYSAEQIDAALQGAWGVDTQLIADGSYFVVEYAARAVACGGWSWRKTLFGGDAHRGRQAEPLDPTHDAARIRAFFVHPEFARQGLGRALLDACEHAAKARGFRSAELVATLPGERLYRACGYASEGPRDYDLVGGQNIVFVPMRKAFSGL